MGDEKVPGSGPAAAGSSIPARCKAGKGLGGTCTPPPRPGAVRCCRLAPYPMWHPDGEEFGPGALGAESQVSAGPSAQHGDVYPAVLRREASGTEKLSALWKGGQLSASGESSEVGWKRA